MEYDQWLEDRVFDPIEDLDLVTLRVFDDCQEEAPDEDWG